MKQQVIEVSEIDLGYAIKVEDARTMITEPITELPPIFAEFCTTELYRYTKPFSEDGFAYATNGRILVRMPFAGTLESQDPPKAAQLFRAWSGSGTPIEPVFTETEGVCVSCNGAKVVSDCEICYGDGEVFSETQQNYFPCGTCQGCGSIADENGNKCGHCQGFGLDAKGVTLGATNINRNYVALLQSHGKPLFYLNDTPKLAIRFVLVGTDIEGLVMPMGRESANAPVSPEVQT